MVDTQSSTLDRQAGSARPRFGRLASGLIGRRPGQEPAATHQDRKHNPLEAAEASVSRVLVQTWGWN